MNKWEILWNHREMIIGGFKSTLVLFGVSATAAFLLSSLIVLAIWAVLRVRPWDYMMLWVYLIPIVGGITFAHVFFLDGPPFARIPGIPFHHLSIRGFFFGLDIGFRIVAMGFAFVLFSMTTDPFHWGLAMFKAGVPYKGAFMFAFGMRFYPLLQEEYFVIRDALKALPNQKF